MINICENYEGIKSVVLERSNSKVIIVAVSKILPIEFIKKAYDCGIRDFGENRAQEFRDKIKMLPRDIRWHFIGNLQSNKIKYVVGKAWLIHSVDSLKLAKQISDFAFKMNLKQKILLEVKTSYEMSKHGIDLSKAKDIYLEIKNIPNIELCGLMTMAPFTNDVKIIRESFHNLKKLKEELEEVKGIKIEYLSMGMTDDFIIALEEGANIIRIGRGIFGERRK